MYKLILVQLPFFQYQIAALIKILKNKNTSCLTSYMQIYTKKSLSYSKYHFLQFNSVLIKLSDKTSHKLDMNVNVKMLDKKR